MSSENLSNEAAAAAAPKERSRKGIALAAVLIVIVLLGTLVTAAVWFTTQDARSATNGRRMQQSLGVAEGGGAEVIRKWVPAVNNVRALYPADTIPIVLTGLPNGTGAYSGSIYRTNNKMYLVDATGRDSASIKGGLYGGGARQRNILLLRVVPLVVDVKAAFTVGNKVTFGGGNVFIKGADNVPPGWPSCGVAGAAVAGVRAKAAGDLSGSSGQFTGTPNSMISPTMDSTTFTSFGPTNYATLAAQATVQIAGGGSIAPVPALTGGKCNYALTTNWGDGNTPAAACGTYFPIVHITGSGTTTITGGQGQGILLVDGNLVVSGTFKYYGMLVVRGSFSTASGGSPTIYGSVLANAINLSTSAFNGDVNINYSRCAMEKTMDGTGVATPLRSRSWVRPL